MPDRPGSPDRSSQTGPRRLRVAALALALLGLAAAAVALTDRAGLAGILTYFARPAAPLTAPAPAPASAEVPLRTTTRRSMAGADGMPASAPADGSVVRDCMAGAACERSGRAASVAAVAGVADPGRRRARSAAASDAASAAAPPAPVAMFAAGGATTSATTNRFRFLVYGDSRAGDDCHANAVHRTLVERMAGEPAEFAVHLGDMVSGYNANTNWADNGACTDPTAPGGFRDLVAPLTGRKPAAGLPVFLFPVIGNHDDHWTGAGYADAAGHGLCEVFDPRQLLPNHTRQPYFSGNGAARLGDAEFFALACSTTSSAVYPRYFYYAFDYGNAHFVVLRLNRDHDNLEACGPCGPCGADRRNYADYVNIHQLDWLNADLAAARARAGIEHVFVFLRAPLVTASTAHPANVSWPALMRLFSDSRVKLVFSGHNHVYERSVPLRLDASAASFTQDDAAGSVYVVSGGGGSDLYGLGAGQWYIAARAVDHHYLCVEVNGTDIGVTAIRPDGAVIDSFGR